MQTFKKNERLANHRLQSMLFSKGNYFFRFPFRVQWMCMSQADLDTLLPATKKPGKNAVFHYPAKCLLAVSKRNIKSAVARNRVKRMAREAYRKNKSGFYAFLKPGGFFAMLAFVYTAKDVMAYDKVEAAMREALQRLQEEIMASGCNYVERQGQ